MAASFPYALADFANLLRIEEVVWDIKRNDELSGVGDGRVWQAELADPLWTADVSLVPATHAQAEQIAALIRRLRGAQESFYLHNPKLPYPQYDPTGTLLGANVVTIASISAGRDAIALTGLPANYRITLADKMQVNFSSAPVRTWFGEASETVTASGAGTTAQIAIFPPLPPGINSGASIVLKRPAAKMFIMPDSHNPGTSRDLYTRGQSFKAMERRR